jgi:rapamycin-insensitive companion of mTOR
LKTILINFNYYFILEFCNPRKKTCLRAIIDVMYLNQLEVRKAVLDLFYELFAINQPTWSDEVSVALGSIDPSNYQSSWGLTDGFVAAEGKSILPSLRNNVPNICDTHQALLIYCLIENGIIEALIDVIVNSDTFISIRSTILLAKILQIVNTTIPENLCYESIALPNLIYEAAKGNPQALKAISTLQSYQQLLRNRPAPISLYLDFVIQNGHICKTQLFNREICGTFFYSTLELARKGDSVKRRTSFDYTFKSRDNESINSDSIFPSSDMKMKSSILKFFEKFKESEKLIKDSMIFSHVDCQKWDFDILLILFRNNLLSTKIDETQIKLVKLLITYFKPSSNKFSHIEITQGKFFLSNVMVGIELIDFLIRSLNELEYLR